MKRTFRMDFMASAFFALAVVLLAGAFSASTWAQKPAAAPLPAGPWKIDSMHTSVGFSVEHFGISMVHGRFNSFEGIIDADPAHLDKSKVRFTIVTSSIDTNVKMRDDDLRSANFFDAAKYPAIVFQSTRIRKARAYDATSARYTAYGNLTMHGVTKEIAIPFVVRGPITDPHGNRRIGIMMNLNVRRLDFGIGGARKMATGVLAIGNDVNVNISLEAMPEKK